MRLVSRLAGLFVLGLGTAPLISQTAIAADTIVFGAAITNRAESKLETKPTRPPSNITTTSPNPNEPLSWSKNW